MKKFLFLLFTVLIVIVSTGCTGSPAKDMANKFMQYFKEEDFMKWAIYLLTDQQNLS